VGIPIERRGSALPQEQERKRVQKKGGGGDADTTGEAGGQTKAEKLKGEMDEILDEIDEVLEENAEEFIKSYVQKGGE
jgi:prokaryotic ubiquitin-like protein Pup